MKKIFFILIMTATACSSLDKTTRVPAQVNANLMNHSEIDGAFSNEMRANNLKRGNVTIDLSSCNEQTVFKGQTNVINDRCEIYFNNFHLFLKNKSNYGLSHGKGLSFEISNDRLQIFFSNANLSSSQISREIREIVSILTSTTKNITVDGTKLTLLDVIFIKL